MHITEEVSIGYDVLAANAKLARNNRIALEKFGITAFNIMGAIGSGKTLLIEKTIGQLGSDYRIGAIAGDVVARLDASRFEKLGNLICPADYELGEHKRIIIVSVSEGDDIVEKHPLIFSTADLVIVNKIDIAEAVNADPDKMVRDARIINPRIDVLKMSLKTGEGFNEWIDFVNYLTLKL